MNKEFVFKVFLYGIVVIIIDRFILLIYKKWGSILYRLRGYNFIVCFIYF